MPKHYDLRGDVEKDETECGFVKIKTPENFLEVFNTSLTFNLADVPPSVIKALYHDCEWSPEVHDILAECYMIYMGEDIND